MVNMDVIRMSSKGQVVIPSEMRSNFNEGDEFLIVKDEDRIILKKISKLTEKMKEDLEFAKKTEEAYKRHEKGEFTRMNKNDFLDELEKW